MSGFDANPFEDPRDNPFADPAVTHVTSQTTRQSGINDYNPFAGQPPRPTESRVPGSGVPYTQSNVPPATFKSAPEAPPPYTPAASQQTTINTAELQRRQEELERKASELQAREEALKINANAFNPRAHNWPPLPAFCCVKPCFFQDIGLDIPLEFQKVVRALYYLWIFYAFVLFLNFIGGLAFLIHSGLFITFGFSALALVLFVPLSFLCWFRAVYRAFKSDSSVNFMVFFFVFFFQTILTGIYAIGIFQVGSSGFLNGISVIKGNTGGDYAVGVLAIVIGFLWTMATLMSVVLLIKVHRIYRSTGASFTKAQAEFSSGVLRNEHVQSAATNAAAGAARTAVQQTFSGGNQRNNQF